MAESELEISGQVSDISEVTNSDSESVGQGQEDVSSRHSGTKKLGIENSSRRYPSAEKELPPVIRPQWKGDEGR